VTPSEASRVATRTLALLWLLVVGPLDLAATVSRLLPRLVDQPAYGLLALTAARACAAALGVAVGLSITREAPGTRSLGLAWLALELTTLLLVWTTEIVPTNRPPGFLLPTVVVYLTLAGLVFTTTHRSR
jgi:hypothetical protein